MNVFSVLGPPCTRGSTKELGAWSLVSRSWFPCAVSMYGRVGFPRASSIFGCSGSSSVPLELYGRVTSVTCVGVAP